MHTKSYSQAIFVILDNVPKLVAEPFLVTQAGILITSTVQSVKIHIRIHEFPAPTVTRCG